MSRRIAIIGAGFSGLCLGIQLKRAGFDDFTIFEKSDGVGGTWRDNTYPGAACDSPSFAYCYSFEQKLDWTRKWSSQPEILDYIEHCADAYGLRPHLRLGCEIASARFDADAALWRLRSASGEEHEAEVLVSGTGQLNRPAIPDIEGLDDFAGPVFHSARWDHDVPLAGRDVAVVGNAASAIQFVPEIAREIARGEGRLTIFQRSANWMLPQNNHDYSEAQLRRFRRHPWLARLYRWFIWASFESRWPVFRGNRFLARRIQDVAVAEIEGAIRDPKLREALVPDYPMGGRRILISDAYYQTLDQDHVEVVTDPIARLVADAVVTEGGRRVPADVVILATGFRTTELLAPIQIEGLGGRRLHDEWADGPKSYLGITTAGFPNFFMMYGPNTNLGHNSIVFMIECQARYIVSCIEQLAARGLAWLDLRRDVMEAWDDRLQRELSRTAWAATDRSWYKNAAGRITQNWSGTTTRYWWRTRKVDMSVFHQQPRAARPRPRRVEVSEERRPAAAAG
ncbi:MAG: flavin-containing monooxygenase [Myxococcota bacterium]